MVLKFSLIPIQAISGDFTIMYYDILETAYKAAIIII